MNETRTFLYFLRIKNIDIKQFGGGLKNNPIKKRIVKLIKKGGMIVIVKDMF